MKNVIEERSQELLATNTQLKTEIEERKRITKELKNKQKQLLQSEKLASIGQLAAGVAHEINNPMNYIINNIDTLKDYINVLQDIIKNYEDLEQAIGEQDLLKQSDTIKAISAIKTKQDLAFIREDIPKLLSSTLEGSERIVDIVQSLTTFSRQEKDELEDADINQILESTLKITHNETKYKCDIKKMLQPLPKIPCHPGELKQVFINLIVNAAHAIEEKGTITLSTSHEGDYIIIKISDTGHGIAKDNLDKLFLPFFTTKSEGKGTGLGLSISYGIIESHHGSIKVESEIGQGTSFIIKLPTEHKE